MIKRLQLKSVLLGRLPNEISGGEAQRFALARFLLTELHVIVADEPTSRLAPFLQQQTVMVLRSFVDERRIVLLLISHDAALSRAVADRTLRRGSLQKSASPLASVASAG